MNHIKLILAVFFVIALNTACQNKSSSPKATGSTQDGNSGGGLDGSGGDIILSTKQDVDDALTNIDSEILATVKRLEHLTVSTREYFDKLFGIGNFDLVYDFVAINKPYIEPYISKNIQERKIRFIFKEESCKLYSSQSPSVIISEHDESVKGNLEDAEICISKTRLQKAPPSALKTEIIALAFHALYHLQNATKKLPVLADEKLSDQLQVFIAKNIEAIHLPKSNIEVIKLKTDYIMDTAITLAGSIATNEKQDKICRHAERLTEAVGDLIINANSTLDIKTAVIAKTPDIYMAEASQSAVNNISLPLFDILDECKKNKEFNIQIVRVSATHVLNGAYRTKSMLMKYAQPLIPAFASLQYMDAMYAIQYTALTDTLKALNPNEDIVDMSPVNHLVCEVKNINNGVKIRTQFYKHFSSEDGILYAPTLELPETYPAIMVQKRKNQSAYIITVFTRGNEIETYVGGVTAYDGNPLQIEQMKLARLYVFYPHIMTKLSLKTKNEFGTYIVNCEHKTDDIDSPLTIEFKKPEIKKLEDTTYYKNASGKVTLIIGDKKMQFTTNIRAIARAESQLEIFSDHKNLNHGCIINKELAQQKGITIDKIAEYILNNKNSSLVCVYEGIAIEKSEASSGENVFLKAEEAKEFKLQ